MSNCEFCFCAFLLLLLLMCRGSGADDYLGCNTTSSCGQIHNISYPFRLTTDPPNCGNHWYELTCENGLTLLHLLPGKYVVQEINYEDRSIRVVDPGIQKGNCSSLPLYYLTTYDDYHYDYDTRYYYAYKFVGQNQMVSLVSCEAPVTLHRYMNATVCSTNTVVVGDKEVPVFDHPYYAYAVYGDLNVSDVADSCTIGAMTFVSSLRWQEVDTTSYKSIHNAMAFGFHLSWSVIRCDRCKDDTRCKADRNGYCTIGGWFDHGIRRPLLLVLVVVSYATGILGWVIGLIYTDDLMDFYYARPPWSGSHYAFLIGAWTIRIYITVKFACGIPAVFAFLIYTFRRRHKSMHANVEEFLQNQNALMPIPYTYSEIKKMTNKFKQKLGQGGFGSVYKGTLRSSCDVAVKVLEKSTANGQDFINEIATIGRIHHVNVVRLVGFCVEKSKRALVYDFMANGSLEKYIFSQDGDVSLSWENLYDISLGVARGIEYLHKGCDIQILHFDIKPHNILLDENLTPKISDFGLAKLYPADDSIVTLTAARGTMGYMAPELFYKNLGGVSHKADVYSFGMLLMEMAGRRRNLNAFAEQSSQIYFPLWVYDRLKKGKEREISGVEVEGVEIMKKMAIVGLWCIQLKPIDRPSMSRVIEMLEGSVEDLKMPPKPFLTPQETPTEDDGSNSRNLKE